MSGARTLAVPGDPPDPRTLAEAVAVLRGGGIVAHPTETCYGLAVDPWNAEAVRSLVALKGRDAGSGLILLVAIIAALIVSTGAVASSQSVAWISAARTILSIVYSSQWRYSQMLRHILLDDSGLGRGGSAPTPLRRDRRRSLLH